MEDQEKKGGKTVLYSKELFTECLDLMAKSDYATMLSRETKYDYYFMGLKRSEPMWGGCGS